MAKVVLLLLLLSVIMFLLLSIFKFKVIFWKNIWFLSYFLLYRSLFRFLRTQLYLYRIRRSNQSVPKLFQSICSKHPNKTLFYYRNEKWSFKRVDIFSNKIAQYFLSKGYRKGDEIALFMENRPEYVGIWLGLAKAGLISALINNNQRMNQLIHSLLVIECKAFIFSSQLFQG